MPAKGMVHALELLHGLIRPGGELVDIHPAGQLPRFLVCSAAGCEPGGTLLENDHAIEYPQASAALVQAIANGWFERQADKRFEFAYEADAPGELFEFLRNEWSDALLLPEVAALMERLYAQAGPGASVRLVEPVRIGRYKRL